MTTDYDEWVPIAGIVDGKNGDMFPKFEVHAEDYRAIRIPKCYAVPDEIMFALLILPDGKSINGRDYHPEGIRDIFDKAILSLCYRRDEIIRQILERQESKGDPK